MKKIRNKNVLDFSFLPKQKKGATQIGFVLSFAIFIIFLIFMYSAIQPVLKMQASKQSLLELLRFSLIDDFKANDLTIMTINYVGGTPDHNCIKFNVESTNLEGIITDNNKKDLLIKKESGEELNYIISGENNFKLFLLDSTENTLLKIYYSEDIDSKEGTFTGGCRNVDSTNFNIGSLVEEQSQVIESKITELKDKYELDCGDAIKRDLGIPDGNEFTFSFKLADENTDPIEPQVCGGIPNTNIYATEFPVQYLDTDANLQIGHLTIKVW